MNKHDFCEGKKSGVVFFWGHRYLFAWGNWIQGKEFSEAKRIHLLKLVWSHSTFWMRSTSIVQSIQWGSIILIQWGREVRVVQLVGTEIPGFVVWLTDNVLVLGVVIKIKLSDGGVLQVWWGCTFPIEPRWKKQQTDYSFGEVIKNLVWVSKIGG